MVIKTASPGVIVNEVDLTRGTSDAITTNVGGFVGPFERGPVDELVLIETEAELQRVYGNPTPENYEYWYTVSNFLEYGGVCYVCRCDDESGGSQVMRNAAANETDPTTAPYIKNEDDFYENHFMASGTWQFVARNPGTWGNGLAVAVIDAGADYQMIIGEAEQKRDFTGAAPSPDATTRYDFANNPAGSLAGKYVDIKCLAGTVEVGDYVYEIVQGATLDPTSDPAPPQGVVMAVDDTDGTISINQTGESDFTYDSTAATPSVVTTNDQAKTSAPITDMEYVGDIIVYDSDAVDPSKGNFIFQPATKTVDQGQLLGWPAVPRSGQQKTTNMGNTFEFNATTLLWTIIYKPVGGLVNNVYDDDYVFGITLVEDWYEQQIAFQGIPWTRFASRPGTTLNAADKGCSNDEINIIIYDATGEFTGSKGNTLVQFPGVSKLKGALAIEGGNNYYVDVVNKFANSMYSSGATLLEQVAAGTINSGTENVGDPVSDGGKAAYIINKSYLLGGGQDQLVASLGELQIAYSKFTTENISTLDYLLQGPSMSNTADCIAKANFLISIAEERRDCIAFISPPRADVVGQSDSERITDAQVSFYNELTSSSYTVFDSGYKYMYDRWNDEYVFVPLNADIAGCMVRSSMISEPWYSPAGLSRGQILNVVRLPYNPSKPQRDLLYTARINPVVTFPGEGTVLFGDKTALAYSSAFDRINVRKLFLIVEKEIAKIARTNLFEFNDEVTRSLFKNNVNPFLRDIQSKRGMYDFLVVCDTTNNTPEIIDRNEFVADIYIKPAKSINFITLNFIATKTGVTFDESVALFRRPNA